MTLTNIFKSVFFILIIIGSNGCKEKNKKKIATNLNEQKVTVFNFDNKIELNDYTNLNLDDTHPNLLNPQISTSDYNSVKQSWIDLHERIGKHLTENNFNWEVKDSTITIVQKIYFNTKGEIENYFFKVQNTSVSEEKKEEFALLISDFAKHHKINYIKENNFAQCGKTKYKNIYYPL